MADVTVICHSPLPAVEGQSRRVASAGKTASTPLTDQVPPRPAIVSGAALVAGKSLSTRTRIFAPGAIVPIVVPW